jgi:hypothetical protein
MPAPDFRLANALLVSLLAAFCCAALAQDKPAAGAAEEPKAEAPKAPAKGKKEPVLEIKRSGPPDCQVKPVMTDAEIEVCKRAGREKRS